MSAITEGSLACEQALIFVVIKDVARAAKPRVTSRRAQRAGERSGTIKDVARAAKPRVLRACSQAKGSWERAFQAVKDQA